MYKDIDIKGIVELDRLNMKPILDKQNIEFDCKLREDGIKKEISEDAKFIVLERDGTVVGYLEYLRVDEVDFKIPSIQIHPEHKDGFTLVRLLDKVSKVLIKEECRKVTSSVHRSNKPSLKLHEKLGFKMVSEEKDRLRFEIEASELISRIERYTKRLNR